MKTNVKNLPEEHRERTRKLLVTKKQLEQLERARANGLSIVPLHLMTEGRHIKIRLGIGREKRNTTSVKR